MYEPESPEHILLGGDSELTLYRASASAHAQPTLLVVASPRASRETLEKLAREHGLRELLDGPWAARPRALERHRGRTWLVLDDPGGVPLSSLVGSPLPLRELLQVASGWAAALGALHERGLVHRDVKPVHALFNAATAGVALTGFGIAERARAAAEPPHALRGTLAYIAPEQTGRMNRAVDARADLYALGIVLYELATGELPFTASDPMGWVHCHIAKQPPDLRTRAPAIPDVLAAIVHKLLAKAAEDRYQTAASLEHDLRRCLQTLSHEGVIAPFSLATADLPELRTLPERLHGRARESAALAAAFERVRTCGTVELVLVSGYSGIGKSALVRALRGTVLAAGGWFAAGKFDQLKRDIPYASFAQALDSLVRQLRGRSEGELVRLRSALSSALGAHGALLEGLAPELALLLGPQPPLPELPPQDLKTLFQLLVRRVASVLTRKEQPLTLFLDDLQWLDPASLELLESLLRSGELAHLLIVCAYRENEVGPSHVLRALLRRLAQAPVRVSEIELGPLARDDLAQLLADLLECAPTALGPLAALVHDKTAGNPFFALQLVATLREARLIGRDAQSQRLHCDMARIEECTRGEDVTGLMIGKLSRLTPATRRVLACLACLGSTASLDVLALALAASEREVEAALAEAVQAGLVFRQERSYRFLHDRVQEAAYAFVPEAERPALHLAIGMRLSHGISGRHREAALFDLVSQLNRGLTELRSESDREHVAELNIAAARRAKAASAYASAAGYLATADTLIAQDHPTDGRRFSVSFERAECELLSGELAAAEARLARLARAAAQRSKTDLAAVARLQILLYTTSGQNDRAVEVCLSIMDAMGISFSARPSRAEVQQEFEELWQVLGGRTVESLRDLPLADATWRATLDVLTAAQPPALFTDGNLHDRLVARMARLSIEHGNSDGSCYAYAVLGVVLGSTFHDYPAGERFGQLGYSLVEHRGLVRFKARAYLSYGAHVSSWSRHLAESLEIVRRAVAAALQTGDLTFAGFGSESVVTLLLGLGVPLGEVEREAEQGLVLARRMGFGLVADILVSQLVLVRTLRGTTARFGVFDEPDVFDEPLFERHFDDDPQLAFAACWYFIRKLQARFFAGEHEQALAAAQRAELLLWTSPGHFELAEYHLHAALVRAALADGSSGDAKAHLDALSVHHAVLARWARHCPENFEPRALLVEAELARVDGRELEAERGYERALAAARAHGFVHIEALANELASRFHARRGLDGIALSYLRAARASYEQWGASGKVRALARLEPRVCDDGPLATSTIGALRSQLDLAAFVEASRAVAGEIELERLTATLMRVALEGVGGERALLILPSGDELLVEAEARIAGDLIDVRPRRARADGKELAESALRHAVRSGRPLLLGDALSDPRCAADPYVLRRSARSIFCVPLLRSARLVGVLYLENHLASHAFSAAHVALLELLASQMASSLENARLFAALQRENAERQSAEQALRRTQAYLAAAESMTGTGTFGWQVDSGRLFWSEEAFRIYEVASDEPPTLEPLLALVPREERAQVDAALLRARRDGKLAMEHRLELPDGREKHVRIRGNARVDENGRTEIVGSITDITAEKRAREALEEARAMLMHVARTTTLGELAASIAHEVNQPLTAIVADARACLNWLARPTPELDLVRESLNAILHDGHRAANVLARIRGLLTRSAAHRERCRLDAIVAEALPIVESELSRRRVTLDVQAEASSVEVHADPIELQQVLLNLLLNAADAARDLADERRTVRLETRVVRREGGCWAVASVIDSGIGLGTIDAGRLFDAFYTTKAGGLGMGLSISRSIVERHGGRLWAEPNPAHGATFHFELPVLT